MMACGIRFTVYPVPTNKCLVSLTEKIECNYEKLMLL